MYCVPGAWYFAEPEVLVRLVTKSKFAHLIINMTVIEHDCF